MTAGGEDDKGDFLPCDSIRDVSDGRLAELVLRRRSIYMYRPTRLDSRLSSIYLMSTDDRSSMSLCIWEHILDLKTLSTQGKAKGAAGERRDR